MSDSHTSDLRRVGLGVALVVALAGLAAVGFATKKTVSELATSRTEAEIRLAAERGVDLDAGTPTEVLDRILERRDAFLDAAALERRSDLYFDAEGKPVTGHIAAFDTSGAPTAIWTAVDGKLDGKAFQLYPDGSIKRAFGYYDGKIAGQILELYPSGELKLRAVAGDFADNGGTDVAQVILGTFNDHGYHRLETSGGRVQFLTPAGSTRDRNEKLGPDEITGFMLFEYTLFGGQRALTSDSRELTEPGADAGL